MEVAYQILTYRATRNLGDAVQTVAMSRLLAGPLFGVYRDQADRARPDIPFVVNGWLGGPVPAAHPDCTFAGVFVGARRAEQLTWLRSSGRSVGARDPHTLSLLSVAGTHAEMVGCATLTFDRYGGRRSGRYAVDAGGSERGCIELTMGLPVGCPWHEQWALAVARLETLRTAELVVTTRLHVALPCLAYGTPVIVRRTRIGLSEQPERLTLLDALAIPADEAAVVDVTPWAARYLRWLGERVEVRCRPGGPRCPQSPD
ncbi:MAG TPA: polysaccharide pyruvyl transferase family protein [Humisphaera sp.]